MFITREMDYSLRILRALNGKQQISATEIASSENITKSMALKILKQLKHAGIVTGQRGTTGGYSLNAPLTSLSLSDVFNAMNENKYLNRCQDPNYKCENRPNGCEICDELNRIQNIINQEMCRKSISEILEKETNALD